MFRKFYIAVFLSAFLFSFSVYPALAETSLWVIYNTVYGDDYVSSDQNLEDTYGVAYDETFLETDGYVEASARYAGYTQEFGYYTDVCIGNNQDVLFNVITSGYLTACSPGSQNPGVPCTEDADCPDGTCIIEYEETFLVGGGYDVIGFYDAPSTGPPWYSQPLLNINGNNDHMKTFRAPDFDPLNPEYFIAWEDLNLGDADYNDLVVIVRNIEPLILACCQVDDDCPDDGEFCNGDEICEDYVCTHSGDPCAPDLICDEDQDLCYEVTIDVEDGSGIKGTSDNPVDVSLDNLNDKVKALQVDICDVDDYLTCTGCEATVRSEGEGVFCTATELGNGCCRICLVDSLVPYHLIDEGTGPVVTVNYDVSAGAPAGECRDLNPEGAVVSDEFNDPLEERLLPGEFCFLDCSSDQDCDDGVPCTVDSCDQGTGACQNIPDDAFCDDSNVCTNDTCDETLGCQYENVTNGTPCDDGDLCTENDACDNGTCIGSDKDCSYLDDQCNIGVCDPNTGDCVQDTDPKNGDPCDDGDPCTESDICTDGVCAGTQIPGCPCKLKIYKGGVCMYADPIDNPVYNRPGRRGLAMTCCEEVTFCICTNCDPYEIEWTAEVVEGDMGITLEITINPDGTMTLKAPCPCPSELTVIKVAATDIINSQTDEVYITIGRVLLGLGKTNAHPDTQTADVNLTLTNPDNHVRVIQVDITTCEYWACQAIDNQVECDENQDLHCVWDGDSCEAVDNMECTECIVDEIRTPEYICSANELENGMCRVVLYSTEPDDLIQQGFGPVARIKYDVSDLITSKDCICLWPTNRKVADQFNEFLCACPKPGEICFYLCGDVYPQDCYYCESCGDGVVDLYDILEEIDIILGLQTATECQMTHGDVPLGMPPYCGNPPGVNPPNCQTDGVIDIFDALVIIDKALSRMNCCDYCMFGEIY